MKKVATVAITIAPLGFGIQPTMAEVNASKTFKKRRSMCQSPVASFQSWKLTPW